MKELIYKIFVTTFRPILHRRMIINTFNYYKFEELFKKVMLFVTSNRIVGDYLEFGVYRGESFITAYRFAKMSNLKSMNFYAFDSFHGLPKIEGIDADGFRHFSEGILSYSVKEFKKNISEEGVDLNKVTIVQGWYNEVLNEETKKNLRIKKSAVIMIDCDLYKSTVPVLNFVTDYIQDGTILIFDDWFCFRGDPNRGEQRAFREWLENNSLIKATQFHKYGAMGNSFILHR